ncbi:hypothetical protein [Terrimonas sp.]|uniref:hypothetical protein n=1 Tax=Terrimonas sp. TaxID=1914338 RepID=UPI000E32C004|nr:hypothetical protein [Terrimonas sp.]
MNPLSILKSVIISLLLFNLAWAITACKKNNSNSIKSYMRYKVDGEQKQYDTCYVTLMGQFPNSTPPFYYCAIACGRYGNSGIIATLYNNNEISATQYTEAIFSRTQIPTAILGGYRDANNALYISWQNGWPNYPVTVDITEVTARYVKGKFSGTMRIVDGTNEIAITGGEFLALTNK